MSEYMIGSMLILPMLEGPEKGRLQEISEKLEVNTPDLNIGVRELFNREGGISYVSADAGMDFAGEMEAQINDGLPVVMLALYEKYTCLHFGRRLYNDEQNSSKKLRSLKREMLEFKAYGTVTSVTISRWYNVRMIYENLLRFFGLRHHFYPGFAAVHL